MKAEKAELIEIFLHDEHGIGVVEFNDYSERTISSKKGIKLVTDIGVEYISDNKIDNFKYSLLTSDKRFVLAGTDWSVEKINEAVMYFKDYYREKARIQIEGYKKIVSNLNLWEQRLLKVM